jgi:hypothetical protein
MTLEKNVHAHFSRCFPKIDTLFFLTNVQMEGCKLEQLEVEGHKPTLSELKMGIDLNC